MARRSSDPSYLTRMIVLFVVGSFAAAVAGLVAVARVHGAPRLLLLGLVGALLLVPGGFTTLVTANIEYALVALLCAIALALPRRAATAGALIALTVLWKPLLFPLGILLLARRSGRAIAGAVVTTAVALGVSLLLGGLAPWLDYARATANLSSLALVGVTYSVGEFARSLVGPFGLPLIALGLTALLVPLAPRRPLAALLLAVASGILAAPVVWGRYLLLLLPLVLVARDRAARVALIAAIAIGTIEPRIDGSDHPLLPPPLTPPVPGPPAIAPPPTHRDPIPG